MDDLPQAHGNGLSTEQDPSNLSNSIPSLPPPPEPSADKGIAPRATSPSHDDQLLPEGDSLDIFTLVPVAALRMLCDTIETLVKITGDVPPTPPISAPTTPDPQIMQAIADNNKRHAKKSSRDRTSKSRPTGPDRPDTDEDGAGTTQDHSDVPPRAKTPIGSPEAHPTEPIGSDAKPLDAQHGAIARKFYSKKPPPIPLEEYLLRLHKYCPMSTGVYIATSLYIHRLAIVEKVLPVTTRNVHRLLLAGLRVAMKALEDLSYPHSRFAKVGGVTESELGRLEVSFCFVTNFELRVTAEMLLEHARSVRDGQNLHQIPSSFQTKLPLMQKKGLPSRQPMTPAQAMTSGAPAAA